MAIVRLLASKGIPSVDLKVGFNQPATYKAWLRFADGSKETLGNVDEYDLADSPRVTKVTDLDGVTFEWDVRTIAMGSDQSERYRVSVAIRQDGSLAGPEIVCEGKYDGASARWCPGSVLFYF